MKIYVSIFILTLLTMMLLKYQKKLIPNHYFYFARLLDGFDDDITWTGVLFRIFIPTFTGFLAGIIAVIYHFPEAPMIYGSIVGFLSAFCLDLAGFL